jgi:4'-phosphopantetheinyl transferase
MDTGDTGNQDRQSQNGRSGLALGVRLLEVHWFEQSEADIPRYNEWLSASEILRLDSMRVPKRRSDWRLGRWTAKNAVAKYLNLPAHTYSLSKIEISFESSGAPLALVDSAPAPVMISITHRDRSAACAIAPYGVELGCDLETVEPHSEAFLSDYFTAEEQRLFASSCTRDLVATLMWSAKESALKALHEGVRLDTRSVVVSLAEEFQPWTWHALQVRYMRGDLFHGWWQITARTIRTLVANPRPLPPLSLQVSSSADGANGSGSAAA